MKKVLLSLCLILTACLKQPVTTFVILPHPTQADNEYARTICSWNNIPVILADPATLSDPAGPILLSHELKHAMDMSRAKGGCWPFLYRYRADSTFMRKVEFRAYCAEGLEAIRQNRNPLDVWSRIKSAMLLYGVKLEERDNCLFDSKYLQPDTGQYKLISPSDTLGIKPPILESYFQTASAG